MDTFQVVPRKMYFLAAKRRSHLAERDGYIKAKHDERSENGLMRGKTVIECSLRIMILVRVFDHVTVINAPISLKFHRIAEQTNQRRTK